MTNRRGFLLAGAATLPLGNAAMAQQTGRTYRLGWLSSGALRSESYNVVFMQRLGELGFVEGRNLIVEFRSAEGRIDRMPELAADLARQNCDIYMAPGTEATLIALEKATRDAPIVIAANDYDPVPTGHISSLARPGGRITGVYQLQEELSAKRLELLKELLPKARRIAVLADAATKRQLVVVQAAAKRLGLELVVHEFERAPYDYEDAFGKFTRAKAEALLPLGSALFVPARQKIPELALKHRLPGMYNNALWADAGGLLAYGVNFPAAYRRAAEMMAMILNGKKPAEIPVEQSTTFDLVINMPVAKALGVSVPQGIMLRANRLIE
jgi:putative ABC transport system substrate-binding protein